MLDEDRTLVLSAGMKLLHRFTDQVLYGGEESNLLLFWEQRVAAMQKVCKCAQK